MPWAYSNGSGTPSGYTYSELNTLNQHASALTLPSDCVVTQLKMYAAAKNSTVSTRLVLWTVGGAALAQSATFTMAVGSLSGGGQFWYTRDLSSNYSVSTGGTFWVGLYRNPSGAHIAGTDSGGDNAYRKTNTSSFPSVASMSGYSTHSGREVSVGAFYITAPVAPSSLTVTRNSDTSQTIEWTNNESTDQPYDNVKVYRYDNVTGSYYYKTTLSGTAESYTDTTTSANRYYKYKVRAVNDAGNSSYSNEDDINTTPAAPTSVVATRTGGNVEITWSDNATNETAYKVQRNTSADGITWAGYSTLSSSEAADSESYTDTSPANYNYYKISCTCTNPSLESTQVTSNGVIILQPPAAPTIYTPDDVYFDATTTQEFDWKHNSLDGSGQTKYYLVMKPSGGKYPDDLTSIFTYNISGYWTASGASVTEDTTTNLPYTNLGMKISDSDDTGSTIYAYTTAWLLDLTAFEVDATASTTADYIVLNLYVSDVSYFTDFTLKLGNDNSNYFYTSVNPSTTLTNGDNQISVAKSAFSTTGTPNGWDDIDYVRVDITTANNASSEYITIQSCQMVDSGDISALGTYFIQRPEITSEDTGFDEMPANTFVNGESYVWKIRTWGDATTGGTFSDGSSDWSTEATFSNTSTPVATITTPDGITDYAYSELTVEWTYTQGESNNQIQYLAHLYDSSGTRLEGKSASSIVASGSSDSCTFDYILSNSTTYRVEVAVKESNGTWSEYAEITFDTDFLQPTKPSLALTFNTDNATMSVAITNPDVITGYTPEASQDTYIDSDNSSTNYDANGQLQLEDDTAGGTTVKIILLDFDLSSISGKTINSATLVLTRKTALVSGIDSTVNYIKTAFDETTVTYGTIPTLDTTDYDDHTHLAGNTESWDITTLLEDIADGTISDYEGIAIVATTTDGSVDEFYDSTITDSEPYISIEIEPENVETVSNTVYRSVDNGDWEIIQSGIPKNTTITDYVPSIGGNTNYYVVAISATPSSNSSDEVDEDVVLTGYYYINVGDDFNSYVGFIGDNSVNESYEKDIVLNRYEGRTYPVKYEGSQIEQSISFSSDLLNELRDDVITLIEATGDKIYRDYDGRWFHCEITGNKFTRKTNTSYQFSCTVTRVEGE